ncbi:MAG TPA: polyphenol oxidase family protein [Solirubrobacteraceae bacterium]|nr:polyphenol oxidase family protein [Solirubrobacteraceae bacterium]
MSAPELSFELPGGGRALFTARSHGNLSSVGGEDAVHAEDARDRLRAQIGVRGLARGYQVHGAHVRWNATLPAPDPPRAGRDEADGQATAVTGLGTIVLAADCMPVALGADGAVAMLHAGWRGLAGGVLEEGVRLLRERGARGGLCAVIGPCAGGCCYEVGPDVRRALGRPGGVGRARIDLRALAEERLLAAGLARVEHAPACTICDARFFSHRREGGRAGRQAGVAWLS